MPQILKISDGTTTVDFVASTSGYAVSKWNPAVAKRRPGMLGGRGPYAEVVEEMEITVYGTDALSKLTTLQNLMDQAQRWARGEPVAAVLLHYQPDTGSTELKSTILGASSGDMVELPRDFPMGPYYDYIDPVKLRFRRLGLWLGETVTATSGAGNNPSVLTINMTTSVDVDSPYILKMTTAARSDKGVYPSFIAVASGSNTTAAGKRLLHIEAELLSPKSGYSTSADSTNKASGNTVLRYTPSVTTFQDSASLSVYSSTDNDARRWGVFLNYRNNSTAAGYQVKLKMDNVYTPTLIVPEGTSNPTWAFLGAASRQLPLQTIKLYVKASAASGSIDFDSIVLLAMDDETVGKAIALVQNDAAVTSVFPNQPVYIDHQLLSKPSARVWVDIGLTMTQGFKGDPVLTMRGAGIAAIWMGAGETTSTYWRITDTGGTVLSNTFAATRLQGYVAPK